MTSGSKSIIISRRTALNKAHLTGAAMMVFFAATEAGAQTAAADGWYVAGGLTRSFLNDAEQSIFNAPRPGSRVVLTNDVEDGWGGQIAVGRSFGRFRAEVELGHTENDSDRYKVTEPFTAIVPQEGKQDATRVMGNLYFDLMDGPVHPYVGAGIGVAEIDVRVFGPRAPFPAEPPRELIDDSDRRFAYQLMAGASFWVRPTIALTGQYRWLDAGTLEGKDSRGERFIREHHGHNIDVGVRVRF